MGLSNNNAPRTSNLDFGAMQRMKTQMRTADHRIKDKEAKGATEVVEGKTGVQVSSRKRRRGEWHIRVSSRKITTLMHGKGIGTITTGELGSVPTQIRKEDGMLIHHREATKENVSEEAGTGITINLIRAKKGQTTTANGKQRQVARTVGAHLSQW